MRPHYHYILFGIKFDDLVPIGANWRGDNYYTSPRLVSTCWSDEQHNPLGFIAIGNVDFDSCSYVARYTIKKQGAMDSSVYDELGIDPEFCLMSRKPGIGKEYFENNYEAIYKTDEIIIPGYNGAITVKPPPYFDSLLERIDEGKLLEIKQQRKIKSDNYNSNLAERRPGLDMEDLFESQERSYKNTVTFKKKGEL